MNLKKRVSKLERILAPARVRPFAVRYVGPGSENLQQATDEEVEECSHLFIVEFVSPNHPPD